MFSIRKATTDDCLLIRNLASQIWEPTYGSILSREQLDYMFEMMYAPESILNQMNELHHEFFIIYKDGEPSGYLSIETVEKVFAWFWHRTFYHRTGSCLPEDDPSGTVYRRTECEPRESGCRFL